jgi:hypothetical protein
VVSVVLASLQSLRALVYQSTVDEPVVVERDGSERPPVPPSRFPVPAPEQLLQFWCVMEWRVV